MRKLSKRWRIAIRAIPIIAVLVLIKIAVVHFELDFITVNPLYTSIVAGGIFLFGLILTGTMTDYKESEKMPAEIVGTCDSIHQDALFIKSLKPDFNVQLVRQNLGALLRGFRQDVDDPKPRRALKALNELNVSFAEMDRLGVQVGYITRLKLEQAAIRKTLLRFYYIQRINFLPSAYLLVESIIVLIITLLLLSRIEPLIDAIVVIAFISYIFVYIMMLLRVLEKPFQKEGRTMDDVSLFLMEEMQESLEKEGSKG